MLRILILLFAAVSLSASPVEEAWNAFCRPAEGECLHAKEAFAEENPLWRKFRESDWRDNVTRFLGGRLEEGVRTPHHVCGFGPADERQTALLALEQLTGLSLLKYPGKNPELKQVIAKSAEMAAPVFFVQAEVFKDRRLLAAVKEYYLRDEALPVRFYELEAEQKFVEAIKLLEEEARQGNRQAMLSLSEYYNTQYFTGTAIENPRYSEAKSLKCLQQAADLGLREACARLGWRYFKGEDGVKKDLDKALHLYTLAGEQSIVELLWIQRGAKDMKDLLETAEKQAAAKEVIGYKRLAYYYGHKRGFNGPPATEESTRKILDNLVLATQAGDLASRYDLAIYTDVYEFDPPASPETIFRYFKIAAEGGWYPAAMRLADCYREGKGTEKNPELAFHWSRISEEYSTGGYLTFSSLLPEMIQRREYTIIFRKALKYKAYTYIGFCYERGIGVPKDARKAEFWYKHQKARDIMTYETASERLQKLQLPGDKP